MASGEDADGHGCSRPAAAERSMSSSCDGLAGHYSSIASDEQKADKLREAAMLFSLAERQLDVEDNHEECKRTAMEALSLFKAVGDTKGQADALRLVIHSHRVKSEQGKYGTGDQQLFEKTVMDEAESIAADEVKSFNALGEKYGECAMLLALAEVNFHKRGIQKRAEALEAALSAQELAEEIGARKFEGLATFVLNAIRAKDDQRAEAVALADKCIKIFRELGERKLEGKSWHMMAVSRVHNEEFEDGIYAALQALQIFEELGNERLQAYEKYCIANYYLLRNKGQEALPFAEAALELLKRIDYGLGWKSTAYNLIVDCYLSIGNLVDALATSNTHLEFLKEHKDKRGEATALHKLCHIHMQAFRLKDALSAAEEARDVAQALKDKRWEAYMLRQIAEVHLARKDYDEAEKFAEQAAVMALDLPDRRDEAIIRSTLTQIAIARQDVEGMSMAMNEQKALFQQTGDKQNEGIMLLQSSSVLVNENKLEEALANIEEALEIFRDINDVKSEALAYKAQAYTHQSQGDYESALESATAMRTKLAGTGDLAAEAGACSLLAQIHLQRDNPAEAVRLSNAGQQLCKKAGDKRAEASLWILVSAALLERCSQDGHEAILKSRNKFLKAAQEGLAIAKKVADKDLEAQALFQVGSVHMATGKIGDAMQAANSARSIFHMRGDVQSEAATVLLIAETHYSAGKAEKAIDQANAAINKARQCGDRELGRKAEDLIQRIQSERRQGQPLQSEHLPTPHVSAHVSEEVLKATSPVSEVASVIAAPKGLSRELVNAAVKDVLGQITGDDTPVTEDDALMDLGVDSLSALSFRQNLSSQMGMKMPSSLIFDYPSIKNVTDHIVQLSKED